MLPFVDSFAFIFGVCVLKVWLVIICVGFLFLFLSDSVFVGVIALFFSTAIGGFFRFYLWRLRFGVSASVSRSNLFFLCVEFLFWFFVPSDFVACHCRRVIYWCCRVDSLAFTFSVGVASVVFSHDAIFIVVVDFL